MLAVDEKDILENFADIQNKINDGETVIVSGQKKENLIIISERNYNEMLKAKRNAEYLSKIDESIDNHENGDTISFTMEELRAMEAEDWKPTKKVLEFEKKHGIQRNGENQK